MWKIWKTLLWWHAEKKRIYVVFQGKKWNFLSIVHRWIWKRIVFMLRDIDFLWRVSEVFHTDRLLKFSEKKLLKFVHTNKNKEVFTENIRKFWMKILWNLNGFCSEFHQENWRNFEENSFEKWTKLILYCEVLNKK